MDGLKLAFSFSSPPNQKGLCGPKKLGKKYENDKRWMKSILKKFYVPYSYLSLIADANGLNPFDYEVVEAFWIGNKMLEGIRAEDIACMIEKKFTGPGMLSEKRALFLSSNLPPFVYPHHSFHVFYIGSVSGVLKRNEKQLDMCRVAWGKVVEAKEKEAKVMYKPILMDRESRSISLSRKMREAIWGVGDFCNPFEAGDFVASHWGEIATRLEKGKEKCLQKYTLINIKLANKAYAKSK